MVLAEDKKFTKGIDRLLAIYYAYYVSQENICEIWVTPYYICTYMYIHYIE